MNNKGITLIEIIISIVLISIVLIFLFSLLITVNDINYESEVNSTYLINKSLILKNIEEDFSKASNVTLDSCIKPADRNFEVNELYNSYGVDTGTEKYFPQLKSPLTGDDPKYKANQCLKFTYVWKTGVTETDDPGYLGIYYYKNKSSYVISYIRGNNKATRILPEFEKNNVEDDGSLKRAWNHNFNSADKFKNLYIPIIGSDGKDYSINISYYQK